MNAACAWRIVSTATPIVYSFGLPPLMLQHAQEHCTITGKQIPIVHRHTERKTCTPGLLIPKCNSLCKCVVFRYYVWGLLFALSWKNSTNSENKSCIDQTPTDPQEVVAIYRAIAVATKTQLRFLPACATWNGVSKTPYKVQFFPFCSIAENTSWEERHYFLLTFGQIWLFQHWLSKPHFFTYFKVFFKKK